MPAEVGTPNDRLSKRRAAMTAAGHWRDETLLDHLGRALARTPDKTAIVATRSETGAEMRLSYAEIGRRSDILAARLAALGVGRGDVVSIQLPNWWQFSALHLAASSSARSPTR